MLEKDANIIKELFRRVDKRVGIFYPKELDNYEKDLIKEDSLDEKPLGEISELPEEECEECKVATPETDVAEHKLEEVKKPSEVKNDE